MKLELTVNGEARSVEIDPAMPLLWVLRDELAMTGTKFGCGRALCGACSVHVDGKVVRSCSLPAAKAAGKKVTTIEGLGASAIGRAVERAWIELDVVQCGYCQPGQCMAAAGLLSVHPKPSEEEIDLAMSGNVCRCGTYPRIRAAIHRAGEASSLREVLDEHRSEVQFGLAEASGCAAGAHRASRARATEPPPTVHHSRRELLAASAVVAGGLVLGLGPGRKLFAAAAAGTFVPNPFLRLDPDGTVTVVAKHDEMGQGIHTSLAMLVAEEMEADWARVRVVPAPADPAYKHSAYGQQMTGGSTSTWSSYEQMRQAGAAAREMLVAAAAARWGVAAAGLKAEQGFVVDGAGKKLGFGELAAEAARQPVPASPTLKDPKSFRLVGRSVKRVDSPDKVRGRAVFSLDTRVPGMLVAVVARSPTFGGKVKRFDAGKAQAMPGVKAVVEVPSGVAVVAQSFWHAKQARAALAIEWDEGAGAGLDSGRLREQFAALAKEPGLKARSEGNADAAMEQAAKRLEAVYEVPYLAHAPMEPLSCLVTLSDGGAEIVAGSQFLTSDQAAAAAVLELPVEKVRFENTYLGGAFGRRANPLSDFVTEAAHVAKAARHLKAPIKTVWSREDDIRGGFYRPMWLSSLAAGLDGEGRLLAWRHRLVGQSIVAGTSFEAFLVKDGIDGTSVEGAANLPYAVPNLQVELHTPALPVTTQWWRSVGHSHTGFVTEAFLDEVAEAAGQDPYRFRRALLAEHPRHLRVLDLAAHKAGWGEALPAGRGRGIAVHESFGSFVAQVAEVSLDAETGQPRVHRVVVAIDCGPVVNPDTVRAQMESGVVYALSAVLHGEITIAGGKVKQSNFHDYPVVRMNEAPKVEVSIVASQESMGGVGEVAVPPLAAAVANALFAVTGKRVRRLPIRL